MNSERHSPLRPALGTLSDYREKQYFGHLTPCGNLWFGWSVPNHRLAFAAECSASFLRDRGSPSNSTLSRTAMRTVATYWGNPHERLDGNATEYTTSCWLTGLPVTSRPRNPTENANISDTARNRQNKQDPVSVLPSSLPSCPRVCIWASQLPSDTRTCTCAPVCLHPCVCAQMFVAYCVSQQLETPSTKMQHRLRGSRQPPSNLQFVT